MRRAALLLALLWGATAPAGAVDDPAEMLRSPALEARAEAIGSRLRCLVCQNESIEDSSAPLARDLRRLVRAQIASGSSDARVVAWMVARYGQFVRLQPRFSPATLLLWGMPVLALALGLLAAWSALRGGSAPPAPLSPDEQAELAALLRPRH